MRISLLYILLITLFTIVAGDALAKRWGAGSRNANTEEKTHFLADLPLTGPQGEALTLSYKTTTHYVMMLGLYITDDGYVFGIKDDSQRYYKWPDATKIASLQQANMLPNPLPTYSLTPLDRAIGFSGTIAFLLSIAYAIYAFAYKIPKQ